MQKKKKNEIAFFFRYIPILIFFDYCEWNSSFLSYNAWVTSILLIFLPLSLFLKLHVGSNMLFRLRYIVKTGTAIFHEIW